MRCLAVALSLLGALTLATTAARATPCDTSNGLAGVPIRVPFGAADFGVLPEACAATSLSLETRGALALATEDFYGALLGGAGLRIRWTFAEGPWLSIWIPGLELRLVANASLQPTSVDLGAGALGAHFPLRLADTAQLASSVRLLVPTETVLRTAARTGVELAESVVWNAAPRLELVGGLALPMVVAVAGGRAHSTFVPTLSADASVRVSGWLTLSAGLALRVAAARDHAFESLDPRLALRFAPWRTMNADLSVALPSLGRDRTDVAGLLTLAWVIEAGMER